MDFLEKLNHLMEDRKINKNILSKESGIPYTTIDGFYKKGYQNAKLTTIKKLCDYFDVTLDYLMRDDITDVNYGKPANFEINKKEMHLLQKYRHLDERGQMTVDNTVDFEHQQAINIQHKAELQYTKEESEEQPELYARRIRRGGVANNAPPIPKKEHKMTKLNHFEGAYGAGGGQINDNATMITIEVSEDEVPEGADTTINIAGDSMEPTLSDGDVVYVQHTNQLEIGDIGVFYLDGRNFIKEYGGDELISHNSEYAPIQIHEFSTFVIQGKVLGKKIEGFVEL